MNFSDFMSQDPLPSNKTTPSYEDYPLLFGAQEALLEEIDDFSVIDDFLGDQDMESMVDDFAESFPHYRVFAIADVETITKSNPDFHFDSYGEFFLCVDTSKPEHPVLLWTGEEGFGEDEDDPNVEFKSFAEFVGALKG